MYVCTGMDADLTGVPRRDHLQITCINSIIHAQASPLCGTPVLEDSAINWEDKM